MLTLNNLMNCYHFLSESTLLKVKKDGFLRPNTRLFSMRSIDGLHKKYGMDEKDYIEAKNLAQKMPTNKFIVAIPKNKLKNWADSGLIKEIYHFLKPNYRLEFKIPKNYPIFTREHIYQSPREIKRKYDKLMYAYVPEPHKTNIWIKYFKSTKRIKNEKDIKNIRVPELWLGCKIPLNKIKITHLRQH